MHYHLYVPAVPFSLIDIADVHIGSCVEKSDFAVINFVNLVLGEVT